MFSIDYKLEDCYKITDHTLENFAGQKFPALSFDSELQAKLAFKLQDPDQAKAIHNAYLTHIANTLTLETKEFFFRSLLNVCYLFGCNQFSPQQALEETLKEEGVVASAWLEQNRTHLREFIQEANSSLSPRLIPINEQNTSRVVLLTTTASGGNFSVANAIKGYIEKHKSFFKMDVSLIDVEKVAKKYDPMMIASGKLTWDGIYHTFVQQADQLNEALRLWKVCEEVGKFIPHLQGKALKDQISSIKPHLILSTRNYAIEDVALAYSLGVPFRMIHCDYEVSGYFMHLMGKVHPELVKWWLPSLNPRVFKPLFTRTKQIELHNIQDTPAEIYKKIARITNESLENIQTQFELLGYPTQAEFYKIDEPNLLRQLREQWKIKSHEKVVLIEMGKYGVGVLDKIFNELLHSPKHQLPIKYVFVCGHNEFLKKKFIDQLSLAQESALEGCQVHGLLKFDQMNEIRNLALLGVSKPGGSVVAESIKIGLPLFFMYAHPWEEANQAKVEEVGLAYHYQQNIPLYQQIEKCIEIIQENKNTLKDEPDWENLLRTRIQLQSKSK